MDDLTKSDQPKWWEEPESVSPLRDAAKRTSLSEDTLRRRYRKYIVALSERRLGMKNKFIHAITNGEL
jgi:hypothetical protein